jgi:predicted MFS family arabinose efflux permease
VLATLIVASVAYSLTNAMIGPILVEVARGFHVPVGVAGQARTVLSAAGAVTAFIATYFADRVPRRRQLLLALGAIAAAEVALGLTRSFGWWMTLQAAAGVGVALVSLAGTAAAADYYDDAHRGPALGWITTGYPIAWMLGLPLVGAVADAWGWRASYLVVGAGVAALGFVCVLLLLPPPTQPGAEFRHLGAGLGALRAHPGARGWVFGELLATTAWSGFLVYVGAFFGITYGLPPGAIGLLVGILAASSVVGTVFSGWVGNRFGRRRALLWSTAIASAGIAVPFGLHLTPAASAILLVPHAFSSSIRYPNSGTIAMSLAPGAHGTIMAARALVITLGGAVGTMVGGLLIEVAGFRGLGFVYAALTAGALVVYAAVVPRAPRREPAAFGGAAGH